MLLLCRCPPLPLCPCCEVPEEEGTRPTPSDACCGQALDTGEVGTQSPWRIPLPPSVTAVRSPREYCEFMHGYFHEKATLCSQVAGPWAR